MQPTFHYILPLEPVIKPIYEKCRTFPAQWDVNPATLIIWVIDNLNINDPANVETIANLYVSKMNDRLALAGVKAPDAGSLSDIMKMILQLTLCLTMMYTHFGLWNNGISANLTFYNFVGYDVILTTGSI